METGGSRRRRTLSDENPDSPNLRDFLRVKEDDNDNNNDSLPGLTLRAVLSGGKRPPSQEQRVHINRTLLDVIKDDPNYSKESKKSWKALKSRLRLRRAGAAWTSSVITPASDVPIVPNPNRTISRRLSTRFNADGPSSEPAQPVPVPESNQINSVPGGNRGAMMMRRNSSRVPSLAAGGYGRASDRSGSTLSSTGQAMWDENGGDSSRDGPEEEEEEAEEGLGETEDETAEEEGGGEPRMSLMALLAETDRQMGLDGSTYITGDNEEEEEEEVVESGGVEYNNCCVCMVRHKGSAFIPCGHTFCRLCSRELWVQRGNCPICNGFILEILDIF